MNKEELKNLLESVHFIVGLIFHNVESLTVREWQIKISNDEVKRPVS